MSRKSLLKFAPLALSALVGTAFADDSSVTLYGILDVGVATIDKSLNASDVFPVTIDNVSVYGSTAAKPLKRLTTMVNGPLSDSRWGIRGSEDLGGGLRATFVLESGINLPSGALNNAALSQIQGKNGAGTINADSSLSGQLFNRAANVGLSDATWGSLTLGRVYAPGFDVIGAYDPNKGSQLFSPLGFSGSYGGALGYTEVLRDDNSVRYDKKIDDVNVRLLYKFGSIAGHSSAGRGVGANVGYEAFGFGVQAVYQTFKDVIATSGATFSATNPQGLSGTLYDTSGWMLTAKYKYEDLTVKAGYESYKRKASSDTAASLGGVSEFGYTFTNGTNLTNYSGADKPYKVYWFGGDYQFTKETDLSLGFYDVKLNSYGTGNNDSDEKWIALILDHNLSKRTDVYAGFDHQKPGGTAYQNTTTTSYPQVNVLAVGVRHRF